jgi:pimeloyl-ACP methyl ester carboxylesterase
MGEPAMSQRDQIVVSFPEVRSRDGYQVPAILLQPPAPRGGATISHGYGGMKEEMLGLALAFAVQGWSTVVIDLRGHGAHPAVMGPGLLDDINGTIDFVRRFGTTLAIGHSLAGRLALASDADRAIGFSPSVVRGISASGRTMMTTFTSPRVREDHPGYLLEILASMPPIPDDGKPRFVVHSQRDVPGIMAGLEALSLRNLEKASVAPLYTEPARDPNLQDYLPIWFNHTDMKLNPDAMARALAWLRHETR